MNASGSDDDSALPETRKLADGEAPVTAATAAAALASDAAGAAQAAVTEAQIAADAAEDVSASQSSLPFRARTRTLIATLVVLLVLYTCYLASELIVPIVLAIFLGLCGNPLVARLQKVLVPRWLGALLVVVGGLIFTGYSAGMLLPPAAEWVRAAPKELRQHVPRLRELAKPFEEANKATESFEQLTDLGPPAPRKVQVVEQREQRTMITMLSEAPRFVGSVLAVMILSYFFMVYGEDLLRKFVTVVPGWRQKRITVDILRSIQSDISRYIFTITVINLVVAVVTAVALVAIGLEPMDAVLWGIVAGVMNFAPYIGPLVCCLAFLLVGLVQFDTLAQAMLVPGLFLIIHLIEGQLVTPVILGRRMAISPVILMIWLFMWGWMWGIAGLLLAVPMLVCFKIYCSRVEGMKAWAAMMEP